MWVYFTPRYQQRGRNDLRFYWRQSFDLNRVAIVANNRLAETVLPRGFLNSLYPEGSVFKTEPLLGEFGELAPPYPHNSADFWCVSSPLRARAGSPLAAKPRKFRLQACVFFLTLSGMYQELFTRQLVTLFEIYKTSTGRTKTFVSDAMFGKGKDRRFFVEIQKPGVGFTVRRYDVAMQWFSDNWPDDLPWPWDIPRLPPTIRETPPEAPASDDNPEAA